MSPDLQVTTSAPCGHVAPEPLVYHRFKDGASTSNPTRSAATLAGPRAQDRALLVAHRRVRGARRRSVAGVRADPPEDLPVVGDAVLPGADPVAAAVTGPRGDGAAQHRRPLSRALARPPPARSDHRRSGARSVSQRARPRGQDREAAARTR